MCEQGDINLSSYSKVPGLSTIARALKDVIVALS